MSTPNSHLVVSRRLLPLLLLLFASGPAHAQLPTQHVLTLEASEVVTDAAAEKAADLNARVVIAVVDGAGYLILLKRLDGTQLASVQVAIDKARTAAIYRRPSAVFEEQVSSGRVSALALAGAAALRGGIPIVVDGEVVGAIGVSGETPAIDEEIALAGAATATSAAMLGSRSP